MEVPRKCGEGGGSVVIKPVTADDDVAFTVLMTEYRAAVRKRLGEAVPNLFEIDIMPDMRHYRAAFFAARHIQRDNCARVHSAEAEADAPHADTPRGDVLYCDMKACGILARLDPADPAAVMYYIVLTALGATVVGYTPEDKIRDAWQAGEIILADTRQAYFLSPETTEISPPLLCSPNMEDDICDAIAESENDHDDREQDHELYTAFDVLLIEVNCADDAVDFCRAADIAERPVMFTSGTEIALKTALMLYQGRAIVDKNCGIQKENLAAIAAKYGAVLY